MLVSKNRLTPGIDSTTFSCLALDARGVRVLPITPAIARQSTCIDLPRGNPADRLIAVEALRHDAVLLTVDLLLRDSDWATTLWQETFHQTTNRFLSGTIRPPKKDNH